MRLSEARYAVQQVEIRVNGLLGQNWSNWFESLSLEHTADGQTILSGELPDQAALYGLLERLSGLGLQLVSVAVAATSSPGVEGR